jgi:hypothetical protein
MLIDPYQTNWHAELLAQSRQLPDGAQLVLLIDGAFVPGLFRHLSKTSEPALLFERLPGCNDKVKDVSPFLVPFASGNQALHRVLERCEGLPMLSAIVTSDSIDVLAERLAAWCTVATGGDYFNFRFPDTRRLPAIFATLMPQQQRELVGNALSWHYMARNGAWAALPIDCAGPAAGITANARLSEVQFARLIEDSEADELWVRLQYGGDTWDGLPSERHDLLKEAVQVARQHNLDDTATLIWCAKLMAMGAPGNQVNVEHVFLNFQKELKGRFNDDLQNTV